jgi:hypothetical protein
MRYRQALIPSIAVLIASALHAQPKPTLVLEFEDGFDGVGPNGPVKATPEGQPKLADGKFRKALLSGPGTGYLQFATEGVVQPSRGTVEMWVCPVDWDGTEEKFHTFFDVRGQGALYLYKYYQGGLLMLTCPNVTGPYHSASADIKAWQPGEWHHIAGTWREGKQCVYVDGKLIGSTTPAVPTSLEPTFRIGDHPWHIERTSSSLVDRVRIYDRCLSDDEIAAHFAGEYDTKVPLSEKTLDFRYTVDPEALQVRAVAELVGGVDVDETQVTGAFSLTQAGNSERPAQPVPFATGGAEATLPVGDLKPGSYEVAVTISAPGLAPVRMAKPLDIPSRDWLGNRIGLEDVVLPPWTPLEVEKGANPVVRCWGREYVFEGSALPSQIVSAGKPMLARPMPLAVTVAGTPLQWRDGKAEVRSASPTVAELDGTATAPCAGGTATLRTHLRIEYDGLLLLDVALELPNGVHPDSVALEIPLRPEVAYYRHRWSPDWAGHSGNLPEGTGIVDQDRFIPYAWLGDNDRGLFWFCETSQQWPNYAADNAFGTARTADAVTMRLNLLAAGQALPEGWRYECGLQATPVKPLPRDWRKWRLTPAPRANVHIVWPTPTKDSMKYFGYPEASDPETFAARVNDFHAKGSNVVPYSCLSFLSGASGEFQWFGGKWGMGGGDAGSSDVAAYGAVFEMVCPKGEGYGDFIVAKNREFMDRYGLDGFYHDNTHPYSCGKENTGCGYRRDGNLVPTYPILAYRALYRRLYAMVKSHDRPTFTMAHMSGKVTIPVLAYEDSYLDGEHFRGRVKDSYLDLLPLDTFRAEFMGRQWGIMPYFLPEFTPPYSEQVEPTRGLAGLLMIHDVATWAIWCNAQVFAEAFDALDAFGYVDADFIPYFDPEPPVTTDMPDVYASAYTLPGRALIVVANVSREDRSGSVQLNGKRLGLPVDTVVTWPDKTPVAATNGRLELDVPKLGYRMLVVGTLP